MKKSIPVTELQARLREIAATWPKGDTHFVHVKVTGIEAAIPPESQHESAIKAREYAALARKFAGSDKGALFLMKAESARKDFELFDDAVKGAKHGKEQADRAAAGGKLTEATRQWIAKTYWEKVFNGERYGAAQYLAGHYEVSETTIHNIAKKYKPDSIDK